MHLIFILRIPGSLFCYPEKEKSYFRSSEKTVNYKMIKKYFVMGICLLLFLQAYSQNYFNKLYSDSAYYGYSNPYGFLSVFETVDGYIAAGNTHKNYVIAISIVKFNFSGDTLWHKTYSHPSAGVYSPRMAATKNGFAIASALSDTITPNVKNIFLAEFDLNGNELWSRRFFRPWGEEAPTAIKYCEDGGFVIAGATNSIGAGSGDFYLLKTDSLGNKQWEKAFGGTNLDIAHSVIVSSEGGFLIGGLSNSYSTDYNVLVIKTDRAGNEEWRVLTNSTPPYYSYGTYLSELADDSYLFSFTTRHDLTGHQVSKFRKIDKTGKTIWEREFPYNNSGSFMTHTVENTDGTIVVAGYVLNSQNHVIGRLIKIDPLGNIIWERNYFNREDRSNYIYDIKPTIDGGFIFCGSGVPLNENIQKSWIVKTDCFGCDSLLCFYPDSVCDFYDCTQYPIDAYFTSNSDALDIALGDSLTFINTSANTTSRHWDFGDGSKAYTDGTVHHAFTQEGIYTVSLKVHHAVCSETYTKEITVVNSTGTGNEKVIEHKLKLIPNPASESVTIKVPVAGKMQLYDLYGNLKFESVSLHPENITIALSDTPPGVYMCVLIKNNRIVAREKLVVVR
jgi:PKD repeat protein